MQRALVASFALVCTYLIINKASQLSMKMSNTEFGLSLMFKKHPTRLRHPLSPYSLFACTCITLHAPRLCFVAWLHVINLTLVSLLQVQSRSFTVSTTAGGMALGAVRRSTTRWGATEGAWPSFICVCGPVVVPSHSSSSTVWRSEAELPVHSHSSHCDLPSGRGAIITTLWMFHRHRTPWLGCH